MSRVDRSTLPALGPSAPLRFPAIEHHALSTGLQLRLIAHRNVPVAAAVLLVPGGSASDPAAWPGLAAFTADLLDEGSGGRSALEIADALARCGAELDIEVGPDATLVTLTTLTRFLRPALALLAEMASRPNLADPDVERVRRLRLDRLRQLRDHAPAVAERAFLRVLYRDHPYGHTGLGSESSIAAIAASQIREFHRGAFVPHGATLVIAGDAPSGELLEAAARAFETWQSSDSAPSIDRNAGLTPPPLVPERRLAIVPRPGSAQSELRIGHVCAPRATPDYHALVVLNMILGGQFVSRVNMNLRQDKGYTYGARTGFDLRRGLGPFVLQTSVATEVTGAAVREALGEIEGIRGAKPVTPGELALAKSAITRGYPRGFETAEQVARGVATLALHDLPDSYFEEFVPRIEAITLDDVARAAVQYLDTARMAVVVVGDADRIGSSVAALNLGEPMVLSAS